MMGSDSNADGLCADAKRARPEPRLYIVIRADLQMGKGKAIAQAVHAFRMGVSPDAMEDHTPIICVRADSEEALRLISAEASEMRVPCFVVRDAGLTQNTPGTFTCAAVGPAEAFGPLILGARLY